MNSAEITEIGKQQTAINRELNYGFLKDTTETADLSREIQFTSVFQKHINEHPYVREVRCLELQMQLTMMPIREGDLFAGRIDRMQVGIDPERGGITEAAYFCRYDHLQELLNNNPPLAPYINHLISFWKDNDTYHKCRGNFSERVKAHLPNDDYYNAKEIAYPFFGLGGPCLDYDKLVRLGIPGLMASIHESAQKCKGDPEAEIFLSCCLQALDALIAVINRYADQAASMILECKNHAHRKQLQTIHDSCRRIVEYPPVGLHQAIQLVWIYSLTALPRNYGRMDVYFGDFLAQDVDTNVLTQDDACTMLKGLWVLINARGDTFNNRIIIGGKGRRNEKNADRFAELALRVQEELHTPIPQLSLRWYKGMSESLWNRALNCIASGATFPILYNDDINIPAVAKGLNVPFNHAEQYVPYGCGEFVINGKSIGSPDGALNLAKLLDCVIHNGYDSFEKRKVLNNIPTDFDSFEDLFNTYVDYADKFLDVLAEAQASIYRITSEDASFPLLSMLYDDCIERGKPLLKHGALYSGGICETFGNTTAADSLFTIRDTVFNRSLLTMEQLSRLLEVNYKDKMAEHLLLSNVQKFGNDRKSVDQFCAHVNRMTALCARKHAVKHGFDHYSIVQINNGDSVLLGTRTGATADGRSAGTALANGNQPSAGNDYSGLTALLNSMACLDPSCHAGAVHNVKISRKMICEHRETTAALLAGYFEQGGTQLMITIVGKADLEDALVHPEHYSNLIVRVGGYSEYFVKLPAQIQKEVLKRTLY